MPKCSENLVAIASTSTLSIALLCHMIKVGIRVPAVIEFLKVRSHCEAMLDVKKYFLLAFKGICMNFLLELKKQQLLLTLHLKTAS